MFKIADPVCLHLSVFSLYTRVVSKTVKHRNVSFRVHNSVVSGNQARKVPHLQCQCIARTIQSKKGSLIFAIIENRATLLAFRQSKHLFHFRDWLRFPSTFEPLTLRNLAKPFDSRAFEIVLFSFRAV